MIFICAGLNSGNKLLLVNLCQLNLMWNLMWNILSREKVNLWRHLIVQVSSLLCSALYHLLMTVVMY